MTQTSDNTNHYHHVRLDSAGRLLIPVSLRRKLHIQEGDTVLLTEDEAGVKIRTLIAVVRNSQDYFKQFIPPGVSLVDELLKDRRDEASRE